MALIGNKSAAPRGATTLIKRREKTRERVRPKLET